MTRALASTLVIAMAGLTVPACYAVVDSERFYEASALVEAGPPDDGVRFNEDLVMTFTNMGQHGNQYFEYFVVDDRNVVRSRGMVLPLRMTEGTFVIHAPQAIPKPAAGFRLDFWADRAVSGKYEYVDGMKVPEDQNDHPWRFLLDDGAQTEGQILTHKDGVYRTAFSHNLDFFPIDEKPRGTKNPPTARGLLPARIHIEGLGKHQGKLVQVRVADTPPSRHVVGLFRFYPTQPFADLTIPDCVESNGPYDVDLYVDANGNNNSAGIGYDNPAQRAGDLGFRKRVIASATGLDVPGPDVTAFDAAATDMGNVDVGPP